MTYPAGDSLLRLPQVLELIPVSKSMVAWMQGWQVSQARQAGAAHDGMEKYRHCSPDKAGSFPGL